MINVGSLVSLAFKTVGASVEDVTRTVTYRVAGSQSYDPATGAVTTSATNYTVQAIFTGYKRTEKESDFQNSRRMAVELGDQKCMVAFADLPIVVTMEDVIIDGGKTWRIVDHSLDPTGKALHTFQLRQS